MDPLAQGQLAAFLQRIGGTHTLILCTHELVSLGTMDLMELLTGGLQRDHLLLPLHGRLLVVQVFPAAEGNVLVIALEPIDPGLHELARRHVPMVVASNSVEDTLLLSIIEPNSYLFQSVFVFFFLLHKPHTISIAVPGHSEISSPDLL